MPDARTLRARVALAAIACVVAGAAGCGTSSSAVRTVTVTRPPAPGDTLAGLPDTSADGPATPAVKTAPRGYRRCDANITARRRTTTCPFAENIFYAYWHDDGAQRISAFSPANDVTYDVSCETSAERVICRGGDGAVTRFSTAAVARYTAAQARAYSASHDLGPTPPPRSQSRTVEATPAPPAPAAPPPADPAADFCTSHDCIPNFDNGNGSVVQCADGTYSQSGGIQGACSHHGGVG